MKSKALLIFVALLSSDVFAVENIAFLNNPSPQDVIDIGKYVLKDTSQPFFNTVVIFAANINGDNPNAPELYYNKELSTLFEKNISTIRKLQQEGIKVQLSYLGNHQNAGWSCNMTATTTQQLANNMVNDINKYGLDGINIDDEYSNCGGSTQSFYNVLAAIKNNKQFTNKILTKALWSDSIYFSGSTNIAPLLNEGYEMSYGGNISDLSPYLTDGMSKSALLLGISPEYNSVGAVYGITKSVLDNQYAGVMLWAVNSFFPSTNDAANYYTQIAKAEYGEMAQVIYK